MSYIHLSALLLISVLAFSQTQADSAKKALEVRRKIEEDYRMRNDWAYVKKFEAANAKLPVPQGKNDRVVFMGNSITQGWPDQDPEFFKSHPNYINRGIGGQTTPQMLIRFRPDVINLQPRAVIILAGTNDIAGNTGPMTVEATIGNIISMAELATANGIRVVISSILPVYDYPWKRGLEPPAKISFINQKLKAYARSHRLIYVDYYAAMVDERKGLKPELTYDGVHPNKAGYLVMDPLDETAINAALKFKLKRFLFF